MFHAIFLAVARDTKFEIWITQFSRATNCAFVEWFIFVAPTLLETPATT